jgi:Lrp/AsnC family transcriptional regulator
MLGLRECGRNSCTSKAVFFRYDSIELLMLQIAQFELAYFGELFMQGELDAYDRRILELLQEDASLSSAQIAERVGLSQSPCWRRIQRLKEEGVIRGQVTLLDRKKIGLNTQIFAEVKLNAHGRSNFTEFTEAIRGFPEVLECYVLMGAVDFLLRIVTSDIEAYERFFFEKLSNVPGIQEVNSIVALSEIKSTTSLPLSR